LFNSNLWGAIKMARKTKRSSLELDGSAIEELEAISRSRTEAQRKVERAKILLHYYRKQNIKALSEEIGVNRLTAYKCIDKALAMGWEAGLKDLPGYAVDSTTY
jgi:hypothetical protein